MPVESPIESPPLPKLQKDILSYQLRPERPNLFRSMASNSLVLMVVVLTVVCLYLFFGISDRYASETAFVIKQNDSAKTTALEGFGLLPVVHGSTLQDALILTKYIHSYDVLNRLDKEFNLKKGYQAHALEARPSLSSKPTQEEFLDYYKRLVKVSFDEKSGIITLQVQDFTPQRAEAIASRILEYSESFTNHISDKMVENQLLFSKREMDTAKVKLESAKLKLRRFQDRHQLLSPAEQAAAITGLVAQLESELVQEQINQKKLLTFLSEDSPKVQASKSAILILENKIQQEKNRLAGNQPGVKLNALNNEYEKLKFEEEFWKQKYISSVKSLEVAHAEIVRQVKFLLLIHPPTLPQESRFPNRLYLLVTLTVGALLLVGIAKLVISTVNDHRDV